MPAPVFTRTPTDGVVSNEADIAALNEIFEDLYDDTQTRSPVGHTHPATQISDSTAAGRAVLTAADAPAQRTALGLGTAATQASTAFAAASHTHPATQISDSTAAGRAVLTAADAPAQRTALGLGTAATQASTAFAAASHTHPATQISDSTVAGRSILTAADAPAQRTALGLGTAATQASTAFATAAQGAKADSAVQPADLVPYADADTLLAAAIEAEVTAREGLIQDVIGGTEAVYIADEGGYAVARFGTDGALLPAVTAAGRVAGADLATAGVEIVPDDAALRISDEYGYTVADLGASGLLRVQSLSVGGAAGGLRIEALDGDEVLLIDADGYVGARLWNPDRAVADEGATAVLAERNIRNIARSEAIRNTLAEYARLRPGINHILSYGQSLSLGAEGWPDLTKSLPARWDCFMYGDAVRPSTRFDNTYLPVGDAALRPLRATVQSPAYGRNLTDEEVAALLPEAPNAGEVADIAAAAMLKAESLRALQVNRDTSRRVVVSCAGHGGKSLAELSPGATPDLWGKLPAAAAAVKAIADAEVVDYSIPAWTWMQGEGDLETSFEDYRQGLIDLRDAVNSEIVQGIAGQDVMPLCFTYQTNSFAEQTRAQLDLAINDPGFVMVGPVYPVTDKPGAHIDANGYRWYGCQVGKVMSRVLVRGEGWQPLRPFAATRRGRVVTIDFHVPVAPLQWRAPYRVLEPHTPPDRGFVVTVDDVVQVIESVEIVADTVVQIVLITEPVGSVLVSYAHDPVNARSGMLCDSDATVAPFNYEYAPDTGHYPAANIAELVGKPYPLNNFCVAFRAPVTEE